MNLCTSARESWITSLWENRNKIDVWINCVRFAPGNYNCFFSGGACPRFFVHSGMIVRLFLQWHWCLITSVTKWMMMIQRNSGREIYIILDENRSLNTPKKLCKTRQSGLWEIHLMNISTKVFVSNESGRKVS